MILNGWKIEKQHNGYSVHNDHGSIKFVIRTKKQALQLQKLFNELDVVDFTQAIDVDWILEPSLN